MLVRVKEGRYKSLVGELKDDVPTTGLEHTVSIVDFGHCVVKLPSNILEVVDEEVEVEDVQKKLAVNVSGHVIDLYDDCAVNMFRTLENLYEDVRDRGVELKDCDLMMFRTSNGFTHNIKFNHVSSWVANFRLEDEEC